MHTTKIQPDSSIQFELHLSSYEANILHKMLGLISFRNYEQALKASGQDYSAVDANLFVNLHDLLWNAIDEQIRENTGG